jgi:FAD/FMN-containing dehydrogenase
VVRYGNTRELCLGLEVVTAQGEVWHGLSGLRTDNTGYDLRNLMIGSEGTLGIITAATLKLFPKPKGLATALLACPDMGSAVQLLQRARGMLDAGLTAFEAMASLPLALVHKHQPDVARVLAPLEGRTTPDAQPNALPGTPRQPDWVVLIEACSSESEAHAQGRLQALLEDAMANGEVLNAVLANQGRQQDAMWLLRETIPLAERREGLMVKHDIGVPASALPAFVAEAEAAIGLRWPQARVVCFGHLGDGNLHYNVQPPAEHAGPNALPAFEYELNQVVFDLVQRHQGTISAEHGIGALRLGELARRKSPVALTMMRAIKQALDPLATLNPGRVIMAD